MKTMKDKKGQMRVVEVILASFVLVGAITFANTFINIPTSPTYEVGDLEKLGYNILHNLDEQRLLSGFVYYPAEWENGNFSNALRVLLPSGIYFDLTIYRNGTLLNANKPIRYGDAKVFSNSNATASVTYQITGYTSSGRSIYDPRVLLLLMTRG